MSAELELKEIRKNKIKLLEQAGMSAFPARVPRDFSLLEAKNDFENLSKDGVVKSVAGRAMAVRGQGAILFIPLFDGTAKLQAVLKKDEIGEEKFDLFFNTVDIGDFVSVTGTFFTTDRGEQSILVTDWMMASKSILPLPDKWHGMTDPDEKLRKRYLDLIFSDEDREIFYRKAKFWEATRNFMKENGFIEVETPTLEVTTGGAEANPFKTHHNDFDIDVYLRISIGELWQKRLMAAGYPKTFEIGRAYRNEGSSPEHLQEFTNMEFYWSFADYNDGMKIVESLYKTIALAVYGKTDFETRGHKFDLADEWKKIEYVDAIKNETGIDVLTASMEEMKAKLDELEVKYEGENRERLMDTLWKYCRKKISGPAFLVGHPKLVSPLAKSRKDNPELTERFQVLIAGSEVGNGFSELNDPIDQRERFNLQQELIERGDNEAMMPEWEFVEMLEHGMPPTCGFGFGERLFAFFENRPLREVTLFPLMKPKDNLSLNKKEELMSAVAVVNVGIGLERWQEMNTVAHLNAAFGARVGRKLFSQDKIFTKDNMPINLNIQNGIVIKSALNTGDIKDLSIKAKELKLEVSEFTHEMIVTTNDRKLSEMTKEKDFDEIKYLGVLIFGEKTKVDELTKELERFS